MSTESATVEDELWRSETGVLQSPKGLDMTNLMLAMDS